VDEKTITYMYLLHVCAGAETRQLMNTWQSTAQGLVVGEVGLYATTYIKCLGLARTIYIRFTYGIFGREITNYTVIYGVYIRFWPTL